jgi:hypothetical protein
LALAKSSMIERCFRKIVNFIPERMINGLLLSSNDF